MSLVIHIELFKHQYFNIIKLFKHQYFNIELFKHQDYSCPYIYEPATLIDL